MAETEKQKVSRFVLATWRPGTILSPNDCEAIEAAQARLFRQTRAARAAGSVSSRKKRRAAKKGGRPRDEDPSPAALYQRERRARIKRAGK